MQGREVLIFGAKSQNNGYSSAPRPWKGAGEGSWRGTEDVWCLDQQTLSGYTRVFSLWKLSKLYIFRII